MIKTALPVRRHGIVTAVKPESVDSRIQTLVRTGTSPIVARTIAEQAAQQQALRDEGVKQEIEVRTRALTERLAAVAVVGTGAGASNAPAEVKVPIYEETTIEKLRTFASEHGLEIGTDLKLKLEIYEAVQKAHATKFSED